MPDLEQDARAMIRSLEIEGEANLRLVIVPQLQAGLTHPDTGAELNGSNTTWFISARRRSLAVAHLQGQQNLPMTNTWSAIGANGWWGVGTSASWALDIVPIDYRGIARGNT